MRIASRFNGPPGSANGGITAGLLAAHGSEPVVEVTLRRPPPLEVDLDVVDGQLLRDGEVIAEAVPGSVDVRPPPSVGLDRAAGATYEGLTAHPFPTCFVCGPEHPTGMHLFPGPVDELVACTWTPQESTAVLVWAALDCPGGWSADLPGRPMVLGRMVCRIDALPDAGVPHVVQGWLLGGEGRKVFTGSALYDATGQVLAVAQATWITLA
ncbi:MAG: hypothetical protein ABIO67_10435 [Mycobacteriales bacterium]